MKSEFWRTNLGREVMKSLKMLAKSDTNEKVDEEATWQIKASFEDKDWLAFSELYEDVEFPHSQGFCLNGEIVPLEDVK